MCGSSFILREMGIVVLGGSLYLLWISCARRGEGSHCLHRGIGAPCTRSGRETATIIFEDTGLLVESRFYL